LLVVLLRLRIETSLDGEECPLMIEV
jgi:hypothetical protein